METPVYQPQQERYNQGMQYRRCGKSGVLLPAISLGLWHNFGEVEPLPRSMEMLHYAFDQGISIWPTITARLMVLPKKLLVSP